MKLLVDLGNSAVAWRPAGSAGMQRFLHGGGEIRPLLDREWGALRPHQVVVCSVAVTPLREAMADWIRERWSLQPRWLSSPASGWGVVNAYGRPERLGVDRWAALVAARRLREGTVVVVDAGSAVTVDLLEANGRHRGGVIAPGLGMMRRALMEGTALPAPDEAGEIPARDTRSAMAAGTLLAAVGVVESLLARCPPPEGWSGLVTGGDASILLPHLRGDWEEVPDLVLKGMEIMEEVE